MHADNTPDASAQNAFDPATWLSQFRAVGGWWIVGADDKVSVGWRLYNYTPEQNEEACTLYREIVGDEEKRKAICEFVEREALYGQA